MNKFHIKRDDECHGLSTYGPRQPA
jgi:hypothetical protein